MTGRDNTPSASTNNGAFALSGELTARMRLKLSTIIEEAELWLL